MKWKQIIRLDSVLYTTLGGGAIGCLVMSFDTHTLFHSVVRALTRAGFVCGASALVAGCIGRLLGVLVIRGPHSDAATRWMGNVAAFVTAALMAPALALA